MYSSKYVLIKLVLIISTYLHYLQGGWCLRSINIYHAHLQIESYHTNPELSSQNVPKCMYLLISVDSLTQNP